MAFRRRQKRTELSKLDATPPWDTRRPHAEPEPTAGPFDVRDAPEDELTRIDLGALRLPLRDGMELRLDLNEARQVASATIVGPDGQLQVGVFAAPRSEEIWADVRREIAESVRAQGGTATETEDGPFGPEVVGTLVVTDGKTPVRFMGVQGPRWFLRGMLVGPAAVDEGKAEPYEHAFRNIVVDRGSEPLPVREPVLLTLPKEIAAQNPDED